MADQKISARTEAAASLATHEYPVNEAGTDKKMPMSKIVGGGNGDLQYNNNGILGGSSQVEIDVNGHICMLDESTEPSTPASGMVLYNINRAGRRILHSKGPSGLDFAYQPAFFSNRIVRFTAFGASQTTVFQDNMGSTAYVAGVAAAQAATNLRTSLCRINYPTTAAVNINGGIRGNTAQNWRGNAANRGGFFAVFRFGFNAYVAANRLFIGFCSTTGAISATADPSALLNAVGIMKNTADTTFWFGTNDGAGAATRQNTSMTPNTTDFWELRIYAPPGNTAAIYLSLKNLESGVIFEHTFTTDLPTNTQFLAPQMVINTGTSAVLASIDVQSMYIETDN